MENKNVRETLQEQEREWREQGYLVDQARELAKAYRFYLCSCYGPDEYDEPDEYGLYRGPYVLTRKTDFELMDRYFALAQEMALRYLCKEFRAVLREAYEWALEGAEYEYRYTRKCRGGSTEEAARQIEREYRDCLAQERQERKDAQENSPLSEGYCRGCVETLAILKLASRRELDRIPKQLLDFMDRNSDPDYEFQPESGKEIKDMELLPETKGLLAMIYRNYWCTEEERKVYDRILLENDRKCGNRPTAEDDVLTDEIDLLDLDGLFLE